MDMAMRDGVLSPPAPLQIQEGIASGLALLMDEWAHGVLIVGSDGRLLHANQAAFNEMSRRGVALQGASIFPSLSGEEAKPLIDGLQRAAEGKRSLVTVPIGVGSPLAMAVIPLKAESLSRRAALVFARASVCDSLMLCFFARSHGLTHTEESVLGILCQGYSAPEIAQQMNIAVSTVRSHVRSLCAKTRCNGVRELVKRLAVLPPVAPALRLEPVH